MARYSEFIIPIRRRRVRIAALTADGYAGRRDFCHETFFVAFLRP